jgi:hypothetical protein
LAVGEDSMIDLVYLVILVAAFIGLSALAHACERL